MVDKQNSSTETGIDLGLAFGAALEHVALGASTSEAYDVHNKVINQHAGAGEILWRQRNPLAPNPLYS